MDWRCASISRAPALQVQRVEFKPQSHLKKKKNYELYYTVGSNQLRDLERITVSEDSDSLTSSKYLRCVRHWMKFYIYDLI
jgi:hypothetical protein